MKAMVIIPTYNELDNIEPVVAMVRGLGEEYHIVIVDDNSPDGTGEVAERLAGTYTQVHVIHRPNKMGLGTAYRTGFQYALQNGADYIFEMDADFSHDPQRLPDFIKAMDSSDLVIGSRYVNGLAIVNWSVKRLVLSMSANWYARTITGLNLTDCTAGFKCFKRTVLEQIDLSKVYSNGYAFQVEMNYRAKHLGFALAEIPIIFVDRKVGQSKMSTKIAREAFWHILKMRMSSLVKPINFAPAAPSQLVVTVPGRDLPPSIGAGL